MTLFISQELQPIFNGKNPFDVVRELNGEIYKEKDDRRVIRFEYNGKPYFLKHHQGVGWPEIFKNLLQLRKPVTGAKEEYQALKLLHHYQIPTLEVLGFGVEKGSPARRHSFLITRELADTCSVAELCEHWKLNGIPVCFKYQLLRHVARVARLLHEKGLNHRDLYSHHFLLPNNARQQSVFNPDKLWMVDLHRAQIRDSIPWRWQVKDVGSLYFSALEFPEIFTQRDIYRFMIEYSGKSLRATLREDLKLWRGAWQRGDDIYTRYYKRTPPHWCTKP